MTRTLTLLAALLPLVALPQLSKHKDTDRVELSDGKQLKGRIVYEDDEAVFLREGRRKARAIARDEIAAVESLERSLAEFVERYDTLDRTKAEALADLATFAAARGLHGESLVVWVAAIVADPTFRPAYEALEARETKNEGWQFKIGKRWKTLEEARAIHGVWKEHWEVETTHFVIRTDLAVERLTSLAVNVERFYLDYYELMRRALPLRVFDELPAINLYVEEGRMPVPPVPTDAWYDWARNELDVRVTPEPDMTSIMSELTRLMLHNSLRGTIGQSGTTPPWCARGLSDVFGSAVVQDDGRFALDFEREYVPLFVEHASAPEPLPLDRILTMNDPEFLAGTHHELARAQAYTLVHFLVFADERKHAAGFGQYLQEAYSGKRSKSTLLKALGVKDEDELEREWATYARAKAGG